MIIDVKKTPYVVRVLLRFSYWSNNWVVTLHELHRSTLVHMHKHTAPIIDMYDASWHHLVEGPIWHGEVVGKLNNFMPLWYDFHILIWKYLKRRIMAQYQVPY